MDKQNTRLTQVKRARSFAIAETVLWLILIGLQIALGEAIAAFLTAIIILKLWQNFSTEKAFQLMTGLFESLLDDLDRMAKKKVTKRKEN